ncbi:type VI secretion system tube protein Hcp [Ramlibacter sp. AW1]|uniref:Type VI secretion system tube protein Hcp n=1 Tax=Ramlibacter aurantiacus TaxID=2801330 RepID=A0A937D0N3_9BURK|nr:type VI secretion system tube protein Hcp [Ramlibacter aurantiacus]MBL0419614.1 type VI secretion system tube protein Hcp [Ramlibacter aurantiacus]
MARDIVHLKVEGTRGAVKGESVAAGHVGEIDVHSFGWKMRSPRDVVTKAAAARVDYGDLVIEKHIDAASTALMSMLATNELVRKAVLSVRRQGVDAEDYLTLTLTKAHVTGYQLQQSDSGEDRMVEQITLAYESVEVSYAGQEVGGARKGATHFHGIAAASS